MRRGDLFYDPKTNQVIIFNKKYHLRFYRFYTGVYREMCMSRDAAFFIRMEYVGNIYKKDNQ